MPLVTNRAFWDLVNCLCEREIAKHEQFYIGMGNPDADILVVGQEKALLPGGEILSDDHIQQLVTLFDLGMLPRNALPSNFGATIYSKECTLNVGHWFDIINYHNNFGDPLNPALLARAMPYTNFNPFHPLLYPPTWRIVNGRAGHYYYGLERLINAYGNIHVPHYSTSIFPATLWPESTFSKCFITELSVKAARTAAEARFSFSNWKTTDRFRFLSGYASCNSDFFRGFKNVIIAAGTNYVGNPDTQQRETIIKLFNPALNNTHCTPAPRTPGIVGTDYMYDFKGNTGSRVVITRNLAAGFGTARADRVAGLMRP
jgi:hypothetical protein